MWFDILLVICRAVLPIVLMLMAVPGLIWLERRIVAWAQSRIGPNRVGPEGILQPLADILKLLFKEETRPATADLLVFSCAPIFAVMTAFMSFAAIPLGAPITIAGRPVLVAGADIEVGMLYVLAILSLGVYGIVLGGWSSDSKYSLLGAMRSAAQMISYELSLGLSLVPVAIVTGSLRPSDIVEHQHHIWYCIPLFVAAASFFICSLAETNRAPFDLPEAEQELVAGFHTEYSALRFGLFFLAEYANMVTVSGLFVTCFLGGWRGPVFGPVLLQAILPIVWFILKTGVIIAIFMWLRATLPRFRYDQLMSFGWKILLPVTGVNAVLIAGAVTFTHCMGTQGIEHLLPLILAELILFLGTSVLVHRAWLAKFHYRPHAAILIHAESAPRAIWPPRGSDSAPTHTAEGGEVPDAP